MRTPNRSSGQRATIADRRLGERWWDFRLWLWCGSRIWLRRIYAYVQRRRPLRQPDLRMFGRAAVVALIAVDVWLVILLFEADRSAEIRAASATAFDPAPAAPVAEALHVDASVALSAEVETLAGRTDNARHLSSTQLDKPRGSGSSADTRTASAPSETSGSATGSSGSDSGSSGSGDSGSGSGRDGGTSGGSGGTGGDSGGTDSGGAGGGGGGGGDAGTTSGDGGSGGGGGGGG